MKKTIPFVLLLMSTLLCACEVKTAAPQKGGRPVNSSDSPLPLSPSPLLAGKGSATETAGGGNHLHYREEDVRKIFTEAIDKALDRVIQMEAKDVPTSLATLYTVESRLKLIPELQALKEKNPLVFKNEPLSDGEEEVTSLTGYIPLSPVLINLPLAEKTEIKIEEATRLLIHECGHHLGITDHRGLDELGKWLWSKSNHGMGNDRVSGLTDLIRRWDERETPVNYEYSHSMILELGALKDARALPFLIRLLFHSQRTFIREYVVEALGLLGNPDAFEALRSTLENKNYDMGGSGNFHSQVIEALGRIGATASISYLSERALLNFPQEPTIREISALGNCGPDAFEPLVKIYHDRWKALEEREIDEDAVDSGNFKAVLRAIGKTHAKEAASFLIDVFQNAEKRIHSIRFSSERIEEKRIVNGEEVIVVQDSQKSLLDDLREGAVLGLSRIGGDVATSFLLNRFQDYKDLLDFTDYRDSYGAAVVVEALGNSQNEKGARLLCNFFFHQDLHGVNLHASLKKALIKLKPFILQDIITELKTHTDAQRRADAAYILGQMQAKSALPHLEEAAQSDPSLLVRQIAGSSIQLIRGE